MPRDSQHHTVTFSMTHDGGADGSRGSGSGGGESAFARALASGDKKSRDRGLAALTAWLLRRQEVGWEKMGVAEWDGETSSLRPHRGTSEPEGLCVSAEGTGP